MDENPAQRLPNSVSSVKSRKGVSSNTETVSNGCFSLQLLF